MISSTAPDDARPRSTLSHFIPLRASWITAAYAALCVLSIIPFAIVRFPPIVDFPNHAARLDLACNRSDPIVSAMYQYKLMIIPDLAVDLVNLPACGIFDSATVLKIVISVSLLLIYVAGWLVQRKLFGRPNAFLFLLPAISLNLVTTMGFINYLAGIATVCLMVAIAIGREKDPKSLMSLCNLGGVVVYFCHLFALAIAIIFFFGLMLKKFPTSAKDVLVAGLKTVALFALPLALLAFVRPEGHSLGVSYALKPRVLVALFSTPYAGAASIGILLLAALYLLARSRVVDLDPRFRLSLALVGLFVLLVPNRIGVAFDVDTRSMIALAYLGLAAFRPARHERELNLAIGFIAVAALSSHLWAASTTWVHFSDQVEEFRRADDVLPLQARVLSVVDDQAEPAVGQAVYTHVTSYATIDRRILNPLEFSGSGMQPLHVTPAFADVKPAIAPILTPEQATDLANPQSAGTVGVDNLPAFSFARNWPRKFDYLIYYHFGRPRNFAGSDLLAIRSGSYFTIFEVKPGRQSQFQRL